MSNNLSLAMSNSISKEIGALSANLIEVGLDSIMEDGLLKDIPILSTAVSMYRIGCSIQARHYVKKLAAFIMALNNGIVDEEKREYYKSAVTDEPKRRNKELEYIFILIDRYIHFNKAEMLAKLYLAYLDESISWHNFTKYSEILDRLLPGDFDEMKICAWNSLHDKDVSDSLLRLVSLGLVITHDQGATVGEDEGMLTMPDPAIKDYELTDFGTVFLRCLTV